MILCDVMMPQIGGREVHEHLARVAPDQAERIVFMTGGAFTLDARTFLETVPNSQIEKPFDGQDLRELVRTQLGARTGSR